MGKSTTDPEPMAPAAERGPLGWSGTSALPSRQTPAWILSVLWHVGILCGLAFLVRQIPRGVEVEADRPAGIVLVEQVRGERNYTDQEDAAAAQEAAAAAAKMASPLPPADELAVDISKLLPQPGAGPSVLELGGGAAIAGANDLAGGSAAGSAIGGDAQTSIFGAKGEGSRFVYLFDRSASMDGYQGRPLAAAKAELIASLKDLGGTHQFQIIFYNERPTIFRPDGGRPRLMWADEANKELGRAFVARMTADGGTKHMEALSMALSLQPDVLFFLTDADEPRLSNFDLARINRLNRGTQIHAVEFGFGPQRSGDNFLVRLAKQNRGQHTYVDVSRLQKKSR